MELELVAGSLGYNFACVYICPGNRTERGSITDFYGEKYDPAWVFKYIHQEYPCPCTHTNPEVHAVIYSGSVLGNISHTPVQLNLEMQERFLRIATRLTRHDNRSSWAQVYQHIFPWPPCALFTMKSTSE